MEKRLVIKFISEKVDSRWKHHGHVIGKNVINAAQKSPKYSTKKYQIKKKPHRKKSITSC